MSQKKLFPVGHYGSPFTEDDRDRTIAALFVAQGAIELGVREMRGDVLNFLMSPRAVSYWIIDRKWLEVTRKAGRVRYLLLTTAGLNQCHGKQKPTRNIERWINLMTTGGLGAEEAKMFPAE